MENKKITYSFTIYLENGDKYYTDSGSLKDAKTLYYKLKKNNECFAIFKFIGNNGDEITTQSFLNEREVN
tara:strand:+ start:211 stop:420 length:210 start_codon:yes stop_codon:yes gene_type:complete